MGENQDCCRNGISSSTQSHTAVSPSGPITNIYTYTYVHYTCYYTQIQWDLSNLDTNGAEESVVVSEVVSSFQRLKCMQEWYTWGGKRCPV